MGGLVYNKASLALCWWEVVTFHLTIQCHGAKFVEFTFMPTSSACDLAPQVWDILCLCML